MTGGDTHHYTNEDGGDRPAARPPSGSRAACPRLPLPSTGRRPPRVPTQPRTKPTASVTAAARHPDRDPDPRGTGPSPARAASCLQRGRSAGRRGREKASGAARTRWARAGRRRARRGAGEEGPARRGPRWVRGASCRGARRLGRPPRAGSVDPHSGRPPACLPACLAGVAPRAARQGRRCSRRVGSQPGERPRAQPGPPSGWPSGLRRCVQVAVSPGGVGSNPTPDKPAFWPAGQTHPSSPRHCLSPHTASRRHLHPHTRNLQSFSAPLSSPAGCTCSCCFSCLPASPLPTLAHPRPPSPFHCHGPAAPRPAPGRAEARSPAAGGKPSSLRRRSDICPGNGLLALAASLPRPPPPALPPGRHPVLRARPAGPPALPSHSEAAEPPPCPPGGCRVPSTLLRRAFLAGPHLPAARPGRVPPSLPAGQRTPAFLARVRPGKGAPLGRERKPCVPVQPTPRRPARAPDLGATAPVPVGSRCPGRSQARPGALPASQPAVPEPGAALPKGPCSPPPPRQSRTPGARSARAQEPGSHAFGSLGLSAVLRMGCGGGGGGGARRPPTLPRSRFPHRPSPASLPPAALARPTPARPESQPARGTLGRDPAVAERHDGARPQRPRSACT